MIVWDKAMYDAAYVSRRNPSRELRHYDRRWLYQTVATQNADNIETIFGPLAGLRIAIIGGGLGWSAEILNDRGFNVIAVDTSPYIQAEKQSTDNTAGNYTRAVILDEDSSNGASRGRVRTALGGWPDLIVSEDIFSSFDDVELGIALGNVDSYRDPKVVAHLVTPTNAQTEADFPLWNAKSMVGWRGFLDAAGFSHHRLFSPGQVWREW